MKDQWFGCDTQAEGFGGKFDNSRCKNCARERVHLFAQSTAGSEVPTFVSLPKVSCLVTWWLYRSDGLPGEGWSGNLAMILDKFKIEYWATLTQEMHRHLPLAARPKQ